MKKALLYFLGLMICSLSTFAQNDSIPRIITDRPTQSTSPYIVPKGSFQIETSAVYTSREDQTDIMNMWSIGNSLFRYGVFENFEVTLAGSFENYTTQVKESGTDSTYNGLGPISAGFKVFLVKEKGIRPEMAIVGAVTFRHLGSEDFSPTYSYPLGKLAVNHTLSKRFNLGYNIGFSYSGEDADGFFLYSGVLGYAISNQIWSFVEVYGNFDHGDFPNHKADLGLTYVLRNNLQLDVSGGFGLTGTDDVSRYFLSAGLSWRIPR